MDNRIEGTGQMGSATNEMKAKGSARLDRAGRILAALGSLIAMVLVVLPALGSALLGLRFASVSEGLFSCHDIDCSIEMLMVFALPAIGIVVAVIVTIVMMLSGGTLSLTLGGIVAFIVGTVALVFFLQGDSGVWVLEVLAVPVGAAAFALALGASLRLIARRRPQVGR
jgi:hypothetical protein